MAEQKHARRRTSSNAATLPVRNGQHARKQSKAAVQPRSAHTADDFLHDFLDASFDPAAYLNATLPPLASRQASSQPAGAVPLAELSAQAQTLLSQLNAQTTRLSNTLTQLTDDILRSGSRLAYEVELLRGETLGLSEMLHETLKEDIEVFVPGGLQPHHETRKEATRRGEADEDKDGVEASPPPADAAAATGANDSSDPEYIKQLQTLTLVRSRLESVIQTFGDAMDFTFPPSEVSVSSGFLSVSAPEPGSEQQSSEEKGQQVLRKLRDEIAGFLQQSDDPIQGIERAAARIEELKELSVVWKGTAEEKGRSKFIESLAKMVEDRHRDLVREMDQAARREGRAAGSQGKKPGGQEGAGEEAKVPGGFGLISQLQKLRSGL
ncbi:hypothetical protein H634G_10385 [Metarhizium anisopliae BRIP 53293]|uniref:Uncharacterized protein n=1 Tax=Metarhizium anisopliae BRIP 53293 TaxID=1291518 RepID=A0A0D9NJV7_METAN|nr:hypothetical protein H634G_10385 [Metarhizium anisopliae BRIP 53293]KJK86885.1 hypothetical protein H633G_09267 [Metarhizium anisopliae BRIP 53284]